METYVVQSAAGVHKVYSNPPELQDGYWRFADDRGTRLLLAAGGVASIERVDQPATAAA